MPEPIRAAVVLAALLPLIAHATEGDWGYAHIFYVKKSLADNWSAVAGSQLTWRDDFSEFYFVFAEAGMKYKFHPSWSADIVFREGWWNIKDEWETEDRPLVNLTWSGKWDGIRIANRSRLEFRYYNWDKKDDLRFRNRTRIEFPQEVLPGGVKPYIEEEFFVGKNSEKLDMNWLMAGFYFKPTKATKLKAGYRWVTVRIGNEWENRNQLVTGLSAVF